MSQISCYNLSVVNCAIFDCMYVKQCHGVWSLTSASHKLLAFQSVTDIGHGQNLLNNYPHGKTVIELNCFVGVAESRV